MTTSPSNPSSAPEQGQIVTVRQRRYVVTGILPSTLPTSPLVSQPAPQHLVALTSIEDDALGEGLQVIWELEPGARISEKVGLPDPASFDPPARLDAFLDAVRWGAIASIDIERELAAPEYRQLELWTSDERTQLTRNTQALRIRLEQIPGEIEAEQAAIRARFADPQPRLFPVAVTFLVPDRFDR